MDKIKPIKVIQIDEDLMNEIEYYFYMKESYASILERILIRKGEYEYNIEIFDHFMEKYNEMHMQFNLISKQILIDNYPEYGNSREYYHEFDFITSTLNIYNSNEINDMNCPCKGGVN